MPIHCGLGITEIRWGLEEFDPDTNEAIELSASKAAMSETEIPCKI